MSSDIIKLIHNDKVYLLNYDKAEKAINEYLLELENKFLQ